MNIVIIGSTGGIGTALSKDLIKNNNLYIGSRNVDKINNLISTINNDSQIKNKLDGFKVDVTDFESIENFLNKSNDFLGSIDCIINCVGSLILKPAHLTTEKDLLDTYRINVFSCFGIMKYGFKYLKNSEGNLILFSSSASNVGLKNHECISSAKAAVSGFVLSAASTYSKYNIRVNAIAPGLVDTPLTSRITNNQISLDYSKELHGLKRIGKPENFIPIVNSLIDHRSDWITGQTFFVDGGLSNVK